MIFSTAHITFLKTAQFNRLQYTHPLSICTYFLTYVLQFEISSLMKWIFSQFDLLLLLVQPAKIQFKLEEKSSSSISKFQTRDCQKSSADRQGARLQLVIKYKFSQLQSNWSINVFLEPMVRRKNYVWHQHQRNVFSQFSRQTHALNRQFRFLNILVRTVKP